MTPPDEERCTHEVQVELGDGSIVCKLCGHEIRESTKTAARRALDAARQATAKAATKEIGTDGEDDR